MPTRLEPAPTLALLLVAWTTACAPVVSDCDDDRPDAAGENVLVILTDDIGVDKTGAYGEHPAAPPTPNIDALAAQGVLFRNAYASPTCSPTRASLLTGRLPGRTGIGRWIYAHQNSTVVDDRELTIPEMLRDSPDPYTSAAVGKWHLVGFDSDQPARDPMRKGFGCHAGSLGNPLEAVGSGHMPRSYFRWEKNVDGKRHWEHTYMTVDSTDEALARMAGMPQPWFLYVAYNSAHEPLHEPPDDLHTRIIQDPPTDYQLYDAMVESVDREIGRLLAGMEPSVREQTTIVYMSDNGTWGSVVQPPGNPRRGKGTVFEGGVRVPMIISGPDVAVPGSETDALVHVVDLFPTIAELAHVDVDTLLDDSGEPLLLDGHSLLPWLRDPDRPSQRDTVYAESFYPNTLDGPRSWREHTVRDQQYKLMLTDHGGWVTTRFHRLDPSAWDEGPDLLEAGDMSNQDQLAYARLSAELDEIVGELHGL